MNLNLLFILLFGISGGEILVILLLVMILFGPKRIPEIARTIGKGINEIKKVQRDINTEIHRYSAEVENPAKEIKEDIEGFSKGLQEAPVSDEPVTQNDGSENQDISPSELTSADDELPYPYNRTGSSDDVEQEDSGARENTDDKNKGN